MPDFEMPRAGQPHVIVTATDEAGIGAVDRDRIIALYKRHGALLFRGFEAGVEDFGRFVKQFCSTSVLNESPGRQAIDERSNIHTVDGGTGAFSLHPELSREPWKPDVAFFGCLSAPSRGGQTTICDGVALARDMPEPVRRGLMFRRLLYIKPTWPSLLTFWLGTPDPSDAQLAAPPPACPYQFRRYPAAASSASSHGRRCTSRCLSTGPHSAISCCSRASTTDGPITRCSTTAIRCPSRGCRRSRRRAID